MCVCACSRCTMFKVNKRVKRNMISSNKQLKCGQIAHRGTCNFYPREQLQLRPLRLMSYLIVTALIPICNTPALGGLYTGAVRDCSLLDDTISKRQYLSKIRFIQNKHLYNQGKSNNITLYQTANYFVFY